MFRILVVEDNANTRQLICAVLKHSGFEALQAQDGLVALQIMDVEHVDLAVVDVMMPHMDGYELTGRLRQTWPGVPILMVTARQDSADKRQGFAVGTDDYMVKPVDEEEMVWRIRALLRRAQITHDHQFSVGAVTLDYNTLTVSRLGEERTLPQKEFQLLFLLLSHPGAIFTRMQLMGEIWGLESSSDDHTLNVHISRLRNRFRDWPELEIQAVRGLGYRSVKRV